MEDVSPNCCAAGSDAAMLTNKNYEEKTTNLTKSDNSQSGKRPTNPNVEESVSKRPKPEEETCSKEIPISDALLKVLQDCAHRKARACCDCSAETQRLRKEVEQWKEKALKVQKFIDKYKSINLSQTQPVKTRTISIQCSLTSTEHDRTNKNEANNVNKKVGDELQGLQNGLKPDVSKRPPRNKQEDEEFERPPVVGPSLSGRSVEDRVKEWLNLIPAEANDEALVCLSSDDEADEKPSDPPPPNTATLSSVEKQSEPAEGNILEKLSRHPLPLPGSLGRKTLSYPELKPLLAVEMDTQKPGNVILTWKWEKSPGPSEHLVTTFELFAYQESEKGTWKKIRSVSKDPMACRINLSSGGKDTKAKYWFAVRAELNDARFGPFSDPFAAML